MSASSARLFVPALPAWWSAMASLEHVEVVAAVQTRSIAVADGGLDEAAEVARPRG